MVTIKHGDCRTILPTMAAGSVQCCVTSPPYFGLRDYGVEGQIGLEPTPAEYVAELVTVFEQVRRVLADDGTLWLNLGDSYANDSKWGGSSSGKHVEALHGNTGIGRGKKSTGLKAKDLIGIPWRVAFALQSAGWWLRQDIIWHKPNPMPESVTDRCTKAHEYIFLLSKSASYYYDEEAIAEPSVKGDAGSRFDAGKSATHGMGRSQAGDREDDGMRNKRSVWTVPTSPYRDAHFATFPPNLIRPCILAGCPVGGTVLDPFGGSGTTGEVSEQEGRNSVLIELNPDYVGLANTRTAQAGLFCA